MGSLLPPIGFSSLLGQNPPPPPLANPYNALLANQYSLAARDLLEPPALSNWQYVRARFKAFIDNLAITTAQREDGETKQAGVRSCLNRHYYGYSSETANSLLIGSWGKATGVRPSRDVDILFLLPDHVYWQYQSRSGNRQSALLQEVKNASPTTKSNTIVTVLLSYGAGAIASGRLQRLLWLSQIKLIQSVPHWSDISVDLAYGAMERATLRSNGNSIKRSHWAQVTKQ